MEDLHTAQTYHDEDVFLLNQSMQHGWNCCYTEPLNSSSVVKIVKGEGLSLCS